MLSGELILNCTFTILHPIDLVVVPYKLDFFLKKVPPCVCPSSEIRSCCFSEIPDSHRSICSYAWSEEGSKNAIRALPFQSTTYDTHKNRVGKGNQFRDRGYQKNVHD